MNFLVPTILVLTAYIAVFVEASLARCHEVLGTSVKLLPGLIVYAALTSGPGCLATVAVLGGLWFDSLSANPLGVTVLALFAVGLLLQQRRELILRDEAFAQFVIGMGANVAFFLLTLVLLFMTGRKPLWGVVSLPPLLLSAVIGGVSTVAYFRLFDRVKLAFSYKTLPESSFRPDREIKRGRG